MLKRVLLILILFVWVSCSYYKDKDNKSLEKKDLLIEAKSKIFIENVKTRYQNLSKYNSKGKVTRMLYILPDLSYISVEQNFLALYTRKDINFQLNFELPKTFELSLELYEDPRKEEISFPAWSLRDPKKYIENNLKDKTDAEYKESTETVKDILWVKSKNENFLFVVDKNNVENTASSLIEPMSQIESKTKANFVIPTIFYKGKDYDSFNHYINLKDLHIENQESIDGTECFILEGTSYKEKDSYNGIFVKMWIGKQDFLVRKIEHYNVVDNSIILTREIHQNINIQ